MSQHTEHKVAAAERNLPAHLSNKTVAGQIPQSSDGPTVFYTNGSVSQRRIGGGLGWMTGWGYIATDGRYGCGKYPQFRGKVGNDPAATTELRAVWHAIGGCLADGPVTVVNYSTYAASILTAWQSGSTTMPGGYAGRRRGIPTLERLRQVIAANPHQLTVHHAQDHPGDILNDAADTLALVGMRWARDNLTRADVEHRAAGIAEGFLDDYRRRR